MKIRKFTKADSTCVYDVLHKSWIDAYSSFIPVNDLETYLNKFYSDKKLKEVVDDPSLICFVSEVDEKVCGWLKLTENKKENRFYLSSIYVLPEYQKLKIGKSFFEIACDEAKKRGYTEIYIGVMIQNTKALAWYEKLGFEFFEEMPFIMESTSVPHLIGKKNLGE